MDTDEVHAPRQRQFVRWFLAILLAIAVGAMIVIPVVVVRRSHNGVLRTPQPDSTLASKFTAGQGAVPSTVAPPTSSATGAPAAAGACTDPSTLTISRRRYAVSMANDYYLWTVTGSGPACTLIGYPSIVERNAQGAIAPAITIAQEPGMPAAAATVAAGTSTASFWVDVQRCDQEVAMPAGTYTAAVSFAGLSSPVVAELPSAIGNCSPLTLLVSPITQGVAAIPGFTTGGTPPDDKPVWSPPKSPGATP